MSHKCYQKKILEGALWRVDSNRGCKCPTLHHIRSPSIHLDISGFHTGSKHTGISLMQRATLLTTERD